MGTGLNIFLVGAVGAITYGSGASLGSSDKRKAGGVIAGLLCSDPILFTGLGGLIAVILSSKNLQSALYAGVSTPVLINTALKKPHATPAGSGAGPIV